MQGGNTNYNESSYWWKRESMQEYGDGSTESFTILKKLTYPKKSKKYGYTKLDELKKRVGEDLLSLFYDKNNNKKKLEPVLYPMQSTEFQIIPKVTDTDRFVALMEVKEGYTEEDPTIEYFFQNKNRKVSNGNVEVPISVLVPGAFISIEGMVGQLFKKREKSKPNNASKKKKDEEQEKEIDLSVIEPAAKDDEEQALL